MRARRRGVHEILIQLILHEKTDARPRKFIF